MYQIPCTNCKGLGTIAHFKHVENGICFECSGSGITNATEAEYNEYKQELERKKQGKYILFNKGSIEYYKTKKEITEKYKTFYCAEYGNYSVYQCYKDKNIVFTNHTENAEIFISNCNEVYKAYNDKLDAEYKDMLIKKIERQKALLIDEDDTEFIQMVNNKIKELETLVSNL